MATVSFKKATRVYPAQTTRVDGLDLRRSATVSSWCWIGPSGAASPPRCECSQVSKRSTPATSTSATGRHRSPAEGPGHRDGVPELRALPAHDGCRHSGLRPEDGRASPRPSVTSASLRPLTCWAWRSSSPASQGALRWSASARRDGSRDRPPAAGLPDGRAPLQPGRETPRLHPTQIAALQTRLGVTHRLRDPRPGRGHDDGDGRRDEGRDPAAVDSPLTLFDRPENMFVAGFIGSPAMNLIPGTANEGGVKVGDYVMRSHVRSCPGQRRREPSFWASVGRTSRSTLTASRSMSMSSRRPARTRTSTAPSPGLDASRSSTRSRSSPACPPGRHRSAARPSS